MPMGLNISPSIWQSYINAILDCLQSRNHCEAIMDDLLLFTPSKKAHMAKLEDLLKALLKNGLKIPPKKCQLFKTELQYMGNVIFIKDRKVCVKPLRSRIEAIQKINPPTTPKGCRSFAGMVNFLSMFCPKLQKLLKPIYDLTRKGRHFIWGKEQEEAFEEIKRRLIKAPVLHMPNWEGRFHLYMDICKFAEGSTLYQIQNGKPKLIAYASKRLPEAARSYLITELELCGLVINIASFSHLLKRVDFDAIVDHLALTHIIKSKTELATPRLKRLLELTSLYSFNLYYMKGKDMILSDFLSRQSHDDSNPHEIIPISFNMYNTLYETYYRIEMIDQYLVQTCLQMKAARIVLPEVQGAQKAITIESPKPQISTKQVDKNKPKLGWGTAGIKHKKPQPVADKQTSSSKSSKMPTVQNITKDSMNFPVPDQLIPNEKKTITRRKIQGKNREQPFYPDLIYRPPPRPPEKFMARKSRKQVSY